MKQFLEIGKIVSVHGLKGEVKVQPWSNEPGFLCEFERLYLNNGKEEIDITNSRVQKNMVVMKLDGIDTVEAAQKMRNKTLYMDRSDVELEEGCYFFQDLIGLIVKNADTGEVYGKITDIGETGANDYYYIKNENGKMYYVPAIPDVIIKTDIENGEMLIKRMEGLFDED